MHYRIYLKIISIILTGLVMSSCKSTSHILKEYNYNDLHVDFFEWKSFFFSEKVEIITNDTLNYSANKTQNTIPFLTSNELSDRLNYYSNNNSSLLYIHSKYFNDSLDNIFSKIDLELRIDWKNEVDFTSITREMLYAPRYKHPIKNLQVPKTYLRFVNMVFEDIKNSIAQENEYFYDKIKKSRLHLDSTGAPMNLWVDFKKKKVNVSSGLLRAVLLNVGYDELDGDLSDWSNMGNEGMLRSLIYIRTFNFLSFLIIHELSHLFLKEEISGRHFEDQCDCISYKLSQDLKTVRVLEYQWGPNSNQSSIPFLLTVSNVTSKDNYKLWGLKEPKSFSQRLLYLNSHDLEILKVNDCIKRIYK